MFRHYISIVNNVNKHYHLSDKIVECVEVLVFCYDPIMISTLELLSSDVQSTNSFDSIHRILDLRFGNHFTARCQVEHLVQTLINTSSISVIDVLALRDSIAHNDVAFEAALTLYWDDGLSWDELIETCQHLATKWRRTANNRPILSLLARLAIDQLISFEELEYLENLVFVINPKLRGLFSAYNGGVVSESEFVDSLHYLVAGSNNRHHTSHRFVTSKL